MRLTSHKVRIAILAISLAFSAPVLWAVVNGYYVGKNITYIVATNAGGGYDAYARLISGHLGRLLELGE